jgi:tripartite-type tricarboxylate transporter receptor subunit TctC
LPDEVEYYVVEFVYVEGIFQGTNTSMPASDEPSNWARFEDYVVSRGNISVANTGPGTSGFIGGNIIADFLDIEFQPVIFEGFNEAFPSVIRGEADCMIGSYTSGIDWVAEGQMQYVVTTAYEQPKDIVGVGDYTMDTADDVPYDNFTLIGALTDATFSFVLPPDTPEAISTLWEDALLRSMNDEAFVSQMGGVDRPVNPLNGEETRELVLSKFNIMLENEELLKSMEV